jgi:N-methylhydantoinase A
MIQVVNANMVAAIRAVSVERGIDPRTFTLVCAGGAGGLHAAELARALGMPSVFVPAEAGVFCSFGMTVTDVRHDHVATLHMMTDAPDLDALNALIDGLKTTAVRELEEEGFARSDISLDVLVDARYPGQIHELTVSLPVTDEVTAETLAQLAVTFHAEHLTQFAYSRPEMPLEALHWRVAASGQQDVPRPTAPLETAATRAATPIGVRSAYFPRAAAQLEVDVFDLDSLPPGTHAEGPAIVATPTTTIVIHEGDRVTRSGDEGFRIAIAPG